MAVLDRRGALGLAALGDGEFLDAENVKELMVFHGGRI
jgi:hypothetical protein